MGMSDFYIGSEREKTLQFSRKQSGELLGDLDEAERQIQKYWEKADENYQIVEGIISPIPLFKKKAERMVLPPRHGRVLYSYSVTDGGYITGEHEWSIGPNLLWAWVHGLARAGCPTYFTLNWADTCRLLVAIYNNECKPPSAHTTLQRVIKPKVQLKTHDDFVQAIMFFSHVYKLGIGEAKAYALMNAGFRSILDLAMASVDEVADAALIGNVTARKLLTALGRDDV